MKNDRRKKLMEKIKRLIGQMDEEELEELLRYAENV